MKIMMAIYGKSRDKSLVNVYNEWNGWLVDKLGSPTHLSAAFATKTKVIKNDVAYKYTRYASKFADEVNKGNIDMLGFKSMLKKPEGYLAFEWDWTASLSLADRRYGVFASLGVDANSYTDVSLDLINQYIQLAGCLIKAEYGFAVQMPAEFMPAGYVIGVACKGATQALVHDANAWRRFAREQSGQSIRNVYGFNLLNSSHLDISVGGERLESWISKSRWRGNILPLANGIYVWTFKDLATNNDFLCWDYEPVVRAREELSRYHIFPWQKLQVSS